MLLVLGALLVPVALAAPAPAPVSAGGPFTFYVAATGNDDNPGTFDSPWRTIQRAASTVSAGSVVYVRGGVYNEAVTFAVSGSAEAGATRFESFPGETAIVDGTGLEVPDGPSALFLIVDRSYLVVRGFELRNYSTAERNIVPAGVLILGASHHVEVSANHIHDIETRFPGAEGGDAHGIAVYGTSANESARDILIVGNELHDLKLGSSEAIAINGNVERFTVADNVVHDVNNIAIDCIGFEGTCPDPDVDQARDGFVINNTVYNVDSFGNPAYGEDRSAGGIYVDGGRDILVERNTVHHANIGIELASEHRGRATSGVTVRSNLVYRNDVTGISIGGYDKRRGSTENCAIINNTVVDNDTLETGTGEISLQFDTRNNTIRNSIILAGAQGKLIGNEFKKNRGNVVDSNLYAAPAGADVTWQWRRKTYRTLDAYRAATGNDAGSALADPRLDENLRLLADSPAIDAGAAIDAGPFDIDGEPRVQGTAIDIGADEAVVSEAWRRTIHRYESVDLVIGPATTALRARPAPATRARSPYAAAARGEPCRRTPLENCADVPRR